MITSHYKNAASPPLSSVSLKSPACPSCRERTSSAKMEIGASVPLLLQSSFIFVFFSFALFFSLFSLLLFLLRMRTWCNCDVCHGFLTSNWALKFDNLSDWFVHLLRHSPNQTIHIHILGNIITANPDNVEHMLRTRFDNYPKGKAFSAILGDLLGHGIFNVDGDHWRFQRKLASLELGSVSVRSHAFQIVSAVVQHRLLPLLASAAVGCGRRDIDLQDVFRRFAFDCICNFSFGMDPGCLAPSLPVSELASAFDIASSLSAARAAEASPLLWRAKRLLNVGSERELRAAIGVLKRRAAEVIVERRKAGFSGRQDLLSRFMATVDDDDYLRDIVVSFLLAGRDTVASGLTTFFWLLSAFPDVESKIRSEIEREMAGEPHLPSFDQLRRMDYTHAALHESLRLYPPVQFDSKFAAEDDVLPEGTLVARGTRVTYHPYAMGRMEQVWGQDCLRFRPERWLKDDGRFCPESPFRYPVFQAGLRVCLGKEMALMEMKAAAVSLIRRFRLEAVDKDSTPKFLPGLTASLKGGLPVVVHEVGGGDSYRPRRRIKES